MIREQIIQNMIRSIFISCGYFSFSFVASLSISALEQDGRIVWVPRVHSKWFQICASQGSLSLTEYEEHSLQASFLNRLSSVHLRPGSLVNGLRHIELRTLCLQNDLRLVHLRALCLGNCLRCAQIVSFTSLCTTVGAHRISKDKSNKYLFSVVSIWAGTFLHLTYVECRVKLGQSVHPFFNMNDS